MTCTRKTFLLTLAGCISFGGHAAVAQVGRDGYRTDVPSVVIPPRPPPRPRPPELSPFEKAYGQAGRPRIILFFNRDLTDETRSGFTVRRREETVLENRVRGSEDRTDTRTASEAELRLREDNVRDFQIVRPRQAARETSVNEADLWVVESAFSRRLGQPGIRMVDRALAIRIAGNTGIMDAQLLETVAMRGLAEVAVVVRHTRTSDGAFLWRASATNTRDGRSVADVVLPESDVANGRAGVGEALAGRLFDALMEAWGR